MVRNKQRMFKKAIPGVTGVLRLDELVPHAEGLQLGEELLLVHHHGVAGPGSGKGELI